MVSPPFPAFSHFSVGLSSSSGSVFGLSDFLNHSLLPVSFFLALSELLSAELLCRLLSPFLHLLIIFSYPFIPARITLLIWLRPYPLFFIFWAKLSRIWHLSLAGIISPVVSILLITSLVRLRILLSSAMAVRKCRTVLGLVGFS